MIELEVPGGAVAVAVDDDSEFAAWYRNEHPRPLATMTIVTRDFHTARDRGATSLDVLYVLVTDNGPSTPWPMIAPSEKGSDGHWYASQYYACGITGLIGGGCYTSSGTTGPPTTAPAAATSP
jgi:hypothetical protein